VDRADGEHDGGKDVPHFAVFGGLPYVEPKVKLKAEWGFVGKDLVRYSEMCHQFP
jgi:hypothetical protein